MEYISAREAAEKWGLTQQTINKLCRDSHIKDARRISKIWSVPADAEKPNISHMDKEKKKPDSPLHPFVKWAGGKGQLLPEIRKRYTAALGPNIKKYAEPFIGGGAVLFDIITAHNFENVYISDINAELINTYKIIRDNVDTLIDDLFTMQSSYNPLDMKARKLYYSAARDEYNTIKINDNDNDNIRKAVLLIYLNKTCFNGLYRVNKSGGFNVPIGDYVNPTICDKDNLIAVSKALKNVEIVHGQFSASDKFIDDTTLVYFDPPYRPLNATSSFTSYAEDNFDDTAQKRLAEYIDCLDAIGAKIIASNSDPKNIDPNDDFFDILYSKYKIERVNASRAINSKGGSRGKISEILITNF